MKPSNTSTLAVLLLNLSCINAFAPPPELNSWKVVNRAAHPPHKNFYLEQLAASPTKEEVKVEASPTEIKTSMETTTSEEPEEEQDKTKSLLAKVKQAGTAGAISYALWELGFWGISIPVCVVGYKELTGHWPDLTNQEDLQKVGAEAFAFVNFARLAVPLRIGLALSTTPWIDENVVQKFMKKEDDKGETS